MAMIRIMTTPELALYRDNMYTKLFGLKYKLATKSVLAQTYYLSLLFECLQETLIHNAMQVCTKKRVENRHSLLGSLNGKKRLN